MWHCHYKEKFDADLLRVNEFNLFILRTLWNLDVCSLLLPHLKDLISSKYERWVIKESYAQYYFEGLFVSATIQQPPLTGTVTSYLPTAILTSRDKPVLSGIGRVGLRYSQRFTKNIIKWSTVMERRVKWEGNVGLRFIRHLIMTKKWWPLLSIKQGNVSARTNIGGCCSKFVCIVNKINRKWIFQQLCTSWGNGD